MLKKSDYQTLFNVVMLVFVISLACAQFFRSPTNEIVIVKNSKLFNEFSMTKELKKVAQKQFQVQKTKMDSIVVLLQGNSLPESQRQNIANELILIREEYDNFEKNFASEQTINIQSRLNGYVKEFSVAKKYKLVLGTENNNAVLYGDEAKDVTQELINYVNKKYEGLQ